MKKPDGALHAIVQSLDPRERKRYAKYLNQKPGTKEQQYTLLYRLLSEQKDLDEVEIRESMGVKGSAFSMLKRYLYEDLLDHVLLPFTKENESSMIRREMDRADYFRSKGLLELAFKALNVAYERATRYECFSAMLEIQDGLFKLILELNVPSYFKWFEEKVLPLQEQTFTAVETLHRVNSAWLPIVKEIKGNGRITREHINRFRAGIGMQEGEKFPQIPEMTTLVRYCIGLGAAYSVLGDQREAMRHRRKVHELYSGHPHFIDDRIVEYCGNLYNLIGNLIAAGEYEEAAALLTRLQEQARHPKLRLDLRMHEIQQFRIRLMQIRLALASGQMATALDLASSAPGQIRNCVTGIGKEYLSTIGMFEVYLRVEQNAPKSLSRVRSLRDEIPADFRKDLIDWLVLTEMLLLYKSEEYDYLAYFCTNQERIWRKGYPGDALHLQLPRLFRRLMRTADKALQAEMIEEFLELEKKGVSEQPLQYIFKWVRDLQADLG